MAGDDACYLSAHEARRRLAEGRLSAEELVRSCLARIAEHEATIGAWAHLDPDLAIEQARNADRWRQRGKPLGRLHGLPVGLKDIFDTKDMPTEMGSPIYAGRRPGWDSAVAEKLRTAGAIILGKTVTTEFAYFGPGKTRNPHDTERTPGGSSSGSAAAVAAFMVPLAIGSQTNGSMIRPASFCGVFGFKPSHGLISRYRALQLSRTLDHVGTFARNIEDVAMLADALAGYDSRDPDMHPISPPELAAISSSEPPLPPRIAFVRTPVWDQAADDTKAAFAELVAFFGERIEEADMPSGFDRAHPSQRFIMATEMAANLGREYHRGSAEMTPMLRGFIEEGREVAAVDYVAARETATRLRSALDGLFTDYDALVTPSAPGEAPTGLESTGSPVFCTIWTLLGLPAINVPILRGSAGMPIGVQLVGRYGDDARLLRTARWLVGQIDANSTDETEASTDG
jgi:Asp-tRNA(Asn)/Glu-tRNA(Gln) amidotransferase A subunit family amidase